jgi:hypothetical protein
LVTHLYRKPIKDNAVNELPQISVELNEAENRYYREYDGIDEKHFCHHIYWFVLFIQDIQTHKPTGFHGKLQSFRVDND